MVVGRRGAEAQREVANDTLSATLYVESNGANAAEVANTLNRAINDALKQSAEVKAVRARSGNHQTWPLYNKAQQPAGWRGRAEVRLESRDFAAAGALIGGLTIDVPFAMQDSYSGADFQPGVQRLTGAQALAFGRDRHSIPSGDFGRSENQGRLMLAALAQLRQEFLDDPGTLLTYIAAGLRHTRTSLPMSEVLRLAFTVTKVDAAAVQNVVVPGYAAMAGTSSIVQLAPSAPTIFADMADDGHLEDVNVPTSPTASLID